MRLKIIQINFTTEDNWIYKLSDGLTDYYVLDERTYRSKGLNSPINKHKLDYLDIGHSILCETIEIDGLKIVTKMK